MKSEQYESSVEVGQSRAPELLPPPDELARIHEELQNGSDLGHACAEIRRLGVDHGATIGTPQVMTALFQAMTHQDETQVGQAAAALAALTADASMRIAARQVPDVWQRIASCLQLPASSSAVPELLNLCGNLAADDVNAKAMSRSAALSGRVCELLFQGSKDTQVRACVCIVNLAAHKADILKHIGSEDQVFLLLKRIAGAAEADTSVHRTALLLGLMSKNPTLKAMVTTQAQKVGAMDEDGSNSSSTPQKYSPNEDNDEIDLDDAEALDAADADWDDLDTTTQGDDESMPTTPT